jgi:mRNA interferase YafQ
MRTIRYTGCFKRDYKREKAGHRGGALDRQLNEILRLLVADAPLPRRNFDHPLSGEWRDHRDCHVRPDLIPLYRKPDNEHLDLVRLGSHSELGF